MKENNQFVLRPIHGSCLFVPIVRPAISSLCQTECNKEERNDESKAKPGERNHLSWFRKESEAKERWSGRRDRISDTIETQETTVDTNNKNIVSKCWFFFTKRSFFFGRELFITRRMDRTGEFWKRWKCSNSSGSQKTINLGVRWGNKSRLSRSGIPSDRLFVKTNESTFGELKSQGECVRLNWIRNRGERRAK